MNIVLFLFVLLPLITLIGYIVVAHMQPLIEQANEDDDPVWWAWQAVAWISGIAAYPGDIWWNLSFGSWIFRERPHEITFTARVKRHYHESSGARKRSAEIWFKRLNRVWPGHIKDRRQ
jgi:hypothetical protein